MKARMAMLLLWGALGTGPALAGDPAAQCYPPAANALPPAGATPASTHCDEQSGGFGADGTDVEFDSEYLLWWTRSAPIPPLVTTSSLPAGLGVLGQPGTTTVIGDRFIDFNPHSGARFSGRYFIDEGWGIASGVFFLENGSRKDTASGLPVLAVPIVDPGSGAETAIRLAGPGAATAAARLEMGQRFWGADISTIYRVDDSREWKVDFFAGFRFLQLIETLKLRTQSSLGVPGLFDGVTTPPDSLFEGLDQFTTRNSFYGGNVGGRLLMEVCPDLVVQAQAQIALGSVEQSVGIIGATGFTAPGQPVRFASGSIFAQSTNVGKHKTDRVAWVPQVGVSVGYRVNEWVRFTAGYDYLYFSSVARPGDQIDRVVDPRLPPTRNEGTAAGATRPFPRIERTDFWAQGFSAGLQLSF